MSDTIRVFVGCEEEHALAVKVLEHSIRRLTSRPVEVMPLRQSQIPQPLPRDPNQHSITSFSFQRFLIPEECGFKGRGIYLDSDQLVQHDIADLWDTPFPPKTNVLTTGGWQSAVMLIDCELARWRIAELVDQIDRGELNYRRLMNLKGAFARVGGALDPQWNYIDRAVFAKKQSVDAYKTGPYKLVHYTHMGRQPWLRIGHPLGYLWNTELLEAVRSGFIDRDEVLEAIEKQYVRPSLAILVGEQPPYPDSQFVFPDDRRKQKKRKAG